MPPAVVVPAVGGSALGPPEVSRGAVGEHLRRGPRHPRQVAAAPLGHGRPVGQVLLPQVLRDLAGDCSHRVPRLRGPPGSPALPRGAGRRRGQVPHRRTRGRCRGPPRSAGRDQEHRSGHAAHGGARAPEGPPRRDRGRQEGLRPRRDLEEPAAAVAQPRATDRHLPRPAAGDGPALRHRQGHLHLRVQGESVSQGVRDRGYPPRSSGPAGQCPRHQVRPREGQRGSPSRGPHRREQRMQGMSMAEEVLGR